MTLQFQMLIDGDWVSAADGGWVDSHEPGTGSVWAQIAAATEGDVDRAVLAAHRAMHSGPWSKMTPSARGQALGRLGELVSQHAPELAEAETRDTGKLIRETTGSVGYVPAFYRYYGGLADKIQGHTLPSDKRGVEIFTYREPIGVVAAIVPWNSPQMLLAVKLAPALAAGNAVVIKPSEHGSVPILEFGKLVEQAGIPPGVVNIVTGRGHPVGHELTRHPMVRRVAFTGGPDTARTIVRNSAENFASVSLELGGKSPQIVFSDADLDSAVNGIVGGIFGASGQSCVAGSRLYAQRGIYDDLIDRLVDRAGSIRLGSPLDPDSEMGPLATQEQLERFESYVTSTPAEGGRVLTGGRRPAEPSGGWFVEPTILETHTEGIRAQSDEIFGPVLAVTTFDDEADAIKKANSSQYGLAAGVWTSAVDRAHRLVRSLSAGIVWVNTYRATSPVAPFGGLRDSGGGRESGADAIYDYTSVKTAWFNSSNEAVSDPFKVQ